MGIKVWLLSLLIFAPKLSDGQGREHLYVIIQAHTHTQGTIEFRT